ncbi:hypothetical protein BCR34DRAFT_587608 [Clohesyomyces aquaticus]|uniref:Uncharacterized protein n=1 Tax=Clohesyomyces aquaticus TaxID=1231657 RepID=A0A1Y1ZNV0_9PLEO|nr:hypothetical protein BCR34DRAFT_587608 [Clohesyomyces aquaticus]
MPSPIGKYSRVHRNAMHSLLRNRISLELDTEPHGLPTQSDTSSNMVSAASDPLTGLRECPGKAAREPIMVVLPPNEQKKILNARDAAGTEPNPSPRTTEPSPEREELLYTYGPPYARFKGDKFSAARYLTRLARCYAFSYPDLDTFSANRKTHHRVLEATPHQREHVPLEKRYPVHPSTVSTEYDHCRYPHSRGSSDTIPLGSKVRELVQTSLTVFQEHICWHRLFPQLLRHYFMEPAWYVTAALNEMKELDTKGKMLEVVERLAKIARRVILLQRDLIDKVLGVPGVDIDVPLPQCVD